MFGALKWITSLPAALDAAPPLLKKFDAVELAPLEVGWLALTALSGITLEGAVRGSLISLTSVWRDVVAIAL